MAPPSPNVLALPRWTIYVHGAQFVLAIAILGLAAYGIHYIPYNALIFALVVALLTMGACAYILAATFTMQKLYNAYLVMVIHGFLALFWVIAMGLVANLAHIWSDPEYCYLGVCYYYKRDLSHLHKRETSVSSYYAALVTGALLSAAQTVTWVLSAMFVLTHLNRRRNGADTAPAAAPSYIAGDQGMPMEGKFAPTVSQQPAPQHQAEYQQPVQQQPVYQQAPVQQLPQQPVYGQQQQPYAPYAQDPIHRAETVSPASTMGYSQGPPTHNASEVSGYSYAHPNVPELSQHK